MLSLCMITKNESKNIENCINSVDGLVDEIIVVDTGSTDDTKEIATKLGCKVYDFEWCNDFAKARNYSIEKASNDWILVLDADEIVDESSFDGIKKFINPKNNRNVGVLTMYNYVDLQRSNYSCSDAGRVFNKKYNKFIKPVHEYVYPNGGTIVNIESKIHHIGYAKEVVDEKDKLKLYSDIINTELEKNMDYNLLSQLARMEMMSENYEKSLELFEKIVFNEQCVSEVYYVDSVIDYMKTLMGMKDYKTALCCEGFMNYCKDNDEYLYLMGHIYFVNEYFAKAVEVMFAALKVEKPTINNNMILYTLAEMFEKLGLQEESVYYYELCNGFKDADERKNKLLGL